ncbi:hypothetical protein [Kitasatospora sp. NPDC093806]|uniref:hypothetical protein n=1 Tax=Kitasatospora sp. NPDC093806 TaxID=3155075 RepID=UPI00344AB607
MNWILKPRQNSFPWLAICTVNYSAVFLLGWALISLTAPRIFDPANPAPDARLDLWPSFLYYLAAGPGMLLLIGTPSIVLLALIAGRRKKWLAGEFKMLAGSLLLLPVAILIPVGTWPMLLIQVTAQILFTAYLMPPYPANAESVSPLRTDSSR